MITGTGDKRGVPEQRRRRSITRRTLGRPVTRTVVDGLIRPNGPSLIDRSPRTLMHKVS